MKWVMKYYSCSLRGCWGVDTSDDPIYFTQSLTPTTCSTSSCTLISGSAKMVDGLMEVSSRTGILSSRPKGSAWRLVSMCMPIHHVSYDLGTLWAVTKSS
ncbi:hypothetical protein L3Q82_009605 [Scortum barcoo]|uniref:Uncharacterized protein n=1 Tax=Scortum barcoo TaxID=214431 RepID=A0ACB8WGU2_9TELE|nr:hypothetical protein L3Q82_009605 [Scortum barcoo]